MGYDSGLCLAVLSNTKMDDDAEDTSDIAKCSHATPAAATTYSACHTRFSKRFSRSKARDQHLKHILEERFCGPSHVRLIVNMVEGLSMQDTSLSLIPARLGSDPTVDIAGEALAQVLRTKHGNFNNFVYARAVIALRRSLQSGSWCKSDHAIVAILLLYVHDLTALSRDRSGSEARRRQAVSLGSAVATLLKTRMADEHRSTDLGLMQTIVYDAWMSTFARSSQRK